jgi:tetratricopeptide (TPR) repeat protein
MKRKFDKIDILMDLSRYEQAIDLLKEKLIESPDDYQSHLNIAYCELREERFDEAEAEIVKAIRIDPHNSAGYSVLALVGIQSDNILSAKENILVALDLEPESALYHSLLSKILMIENNYTAALDAADKGLELDPNNISCLEYKAEIFSSLEQYDLGFQAISLALELNPENASALRTAGLISYIQGNYDKSVLYFKETIRIDPCNEIALEFMPLALIYSHVLSKIFSFFKLDSVTIPLLIVISLLISALIFSTSQILSLYIPIILAILYVIVLRPLLFFFIILPIIKINLRLSSFGRSWVSKQEAHNALKRFGITIAAIITLLAFSKLIGFNLDTNVSIIVLDFVYFFFILVERDLEESKYNNTLFFGFFVMAVLTFIIPPANSLIVSQFPYVLGLLVLNIYETFKYKLGVQKYSRILFSLLLCLTLYYLGSMFHSTQSNALSLKANKQSYDNQSSQVLGPPNPKVEEQQRKEDKERFNLAMNTSDLALFLIDSGYDCKLPLDALSMENMTYRSFYSTINKSQVIKLFNIIKLRCANTSKSRSESMKQTKLLKSDLDKVDKKLYPLGLKLIAEFSTSKY